MNTRPGPFTYTPQRATQPYREGAPRPPGPALSAMLAGRDVYGNNPQDRTRARQVQSGGQPVRPGSLWWHLLNLPPSGLQFPVK